MNESAKPRFLLILSLLFGLVGCSGAKEEPPLAGASLGGRFTLIDHEGRTVTDRDFAGRYRIAYFGFAHCPDVCPTDLAVIGQALRRFEESDPKRAARLAPTFITVDPERDTPKVLKDYVAAFHPKIVGLTGSPQQIADVAKGHAVYYQKGDPSLGGGYNMNHSRIVILFGPKGEPIALLPYDRGSEAVAAELRRWVT
ncbi:MAG TPA: SCO family protein [Allosphingosinicella sp.]|jgi:protein SCO1/2